MVPGHTSYSRVGDERWYLAEPSPLHPAASFAFVGAAGLCVDLHCPIPADPPTRSITNPRGTPLTKYNQDRAPSTNNESEDAGRANGPPPCAKNLAHGSVPWRGGEMRAGGEELGYAVFDAGGAVADVVRSGFISPVSAASLELSMHIPLFSRYLASPIAPLHRSSHSALDLRTHPTPPLLLPRRHPPIFHAATTQPLSPGPHIPVRLLVRASTSGRNLSSIYAGTERGTSRVETHVNEDNGGVIFYSLH